MMRGYSVSFLPSISALAAASLLLLGGCSGSDDPYAYQKVSGKVTYEDGSPIPGEVYVYFSSEAPPVGNKHAKQGTAQLEKNGDFKDVSSHKYADGIVRGKHKVTLRGGNNQPLPATVVPAEFCDPLKTPLEVDTDQSTTFTIKVKKPK